jgi:hypothetical protein
MDHDAGIFEARRATWCRGGTRVALLLLDAIGVVFLDARRAPRGL